MGKASGVETRGFRLSSPRRKTTSGSRFRRMSGTRNTSAHTSPQSLAPLLCRQDAHHVYIRRCCAGWDRRGVLPAIHPTPSKHEKELRRVLYFGRDGRACFSAFGAAGWMVRGRFRRRGHENKLECPCSRGRGLKSTSIAGRKTGYGSIAFFSQQHGFGTRNMSLGCLS